MVEALAVLQFLKGILDAGKALLEFAEKWKSRDHPKSNGHNPKHLRKKPDTRARHQA